jgi:hypothetical protein
MKSQMRADERKRLLRVQALAGCFFKGPAFEDRQPQGWTLNGRVVAGDAGETMKTRSTLYRRLSNLRLPHDTRSLASDGPVVKSAAG